MIAELAAIPIESPTVSFISGVIAIFTLLFLQVLISYISIKSEKFKNFINGRPSVIIENGQINQEEMRRLRISINDLMEQLRLGNTPNVADVNYAVLESNGSLSIVPKPDKKTVTLKDMGIPPKDEILPSVIISDGTLYEENLAKSGLDTDILKAQLAACNMGGFEDVFLAVCDENRRLHIYAADADAKKARDEVAGCFKSVSCGSACRLGRFSLCFRGEIRRVYYGNKGSDDPGGSGRRLGNRAEKF